LQPIIEKRKHYENKLSEVREIILEGENKAREIARKTMLEVREAMRLG